jgi:hypothetical protein
MILLGVLPCLLQNIAMTLLLELLVRLGLLPLILLWPRLLLLRLLQACHCCVGSQAAC